MILSKQASNLLHRSWVIVLTLEFATSMWRITWCLLLLATTCWQRGYTKEGENPPSPGHVSVVIVGGTGDLAKKYLWQGFFHLYSTQVGKGYTFSFYGGGLSPDDKGTALLFEILKELKCPSELTAERCALVKEQFLRLSQYLQLKTVEDYEKLSQQIQQQLKQEGMVEAGRLFYMSVPAFAYADIAAKINSTCRPPAGTWLRVVLEKPFGHDFGSAQLLATQLASFLKEEEMFRIDHYLGKEVVSQILAFRKKNNNLLEPIWNKHHIERIEIVLKETLDCKGRIQFYDQYGVIRDVLQNHLTEVLTLLMMSVPANLSSSEEVLKNKLQVFSTLEHLESKSVVIGQYQSYTEEVQEELNKTKDYFSLTPTFAGVVIFADSPQYDGIPIFMTSGKMLDERVGYARILFKNDIFCVQDYDNVNCRPRQIVFYLGHGALEYPAILVSKNLFKPSLVNSGWKEVTEHKDVNVLGLPLSDYYIQTPVVPKEAYYELISKIFHGRKDSFISTENLLASWAFWTPLLDSLVRAYPRPYPGSVANGDLLNFELRGREAAFVNEAVVNVIQQGQDENFQVMQGKYRGVDMVSAWAKELVERLASDLQSAAEEAIRDEGQFHLALSGGSSPIALFLQLALHQYTFPWSHTHVWLADERCVPPTEAGSNFRTIHDQLLQHVRIPYFNIHPMPVLLNQRLCVEEDGGAILYENEINQLVNASSFHYILLGVGEDGHTASLFQDSKLDESGERLVTLTESPSKPHQRMSLTFTAINKARKVGVLLMGKRKHELVTQLSRIKGESAKYPITKVQPTNGNLIWYLDYDALLG
ncbi:GDH/6PGL endoplasmic bifunctional protein isoform X1 [Colossoma macropomum]|uniref:GDH/6PGL endoplasmic bifunctional protein isoform X1 n=2 Tax=Colossoma macropomum TaxID=42526 RepID=UPI001864EC6B|nr:GDH/6PGL endoplasmic bifunctional protein isoform X1 [Colossoma macropomum]XP_036427052.1 GDH/6PGL endoplasmic bifunctional protein isoform X1 [Colossoma macropomum]